jgi:regulatory protein
MIQALLAKKGFDPEEALPKERQRMYGYLMRKGFAPEQVRRALRSEEPYD